MHASTCFGDVLISAMPPRTAAKHDRMTASQARLLLLDAQGLTTNPAGQVGAARVYELIERMGFVQVDSINVVDRAHYLILASRFDRFRPQLLDQLVEHDRLLFEHWTHDASLIPIKWFAQWKPRFERSRTNKWWRERMGPEFPAVVAHVLERITTEGPLLSRDFEHDRQGEPGGWWGWKPQKSALEHLWRTGDLLISRRNNFQKVYDLAPRVLGSIASAPRPTQTEHVQWACSTALDRLGCATPRELAAFWRSIPIDAARTWCDAALRAGRIVPVEVQSADDTKPRLAVAAHDWRQRLEATSRAPRRARLLCPFDPVLRDRDRAGRLFNFDYRFEAFVPAPKRKFGYYVMPILDGDRLVGRVDPKFHREKGRLEIRRLWWEPTVKVSDALQSRLEAAVARLARYLGANSWRIGRAGVNRHRSAKTTV